MKYMVNGEERTFTLESYKKLLANKEFQAYIGYINKQIKNLAQGLLKGGNSEKMEIKWNEYELERRLYGHLIRLKKNPMTWLQTELVNDNDGPNETRRKQKQQLKQDMKNIHGDSDVE